MTTLDRLFSPIAAQFGHTKILESMWAIATITMLGTFQQSQLRIEVEASATAIRDSLLRPTQLQKWLWFQRFAAGMPEQLHQGLSFTSWTGLIAIRHQVEVETPVSLRFLLSQGVDGYHEWYWGEGWVQSRLEGVSVLPLNLAQTMSLLSLRQYLASKTAQS